jgi:hypothetical protein
MTLNVKRVLVASIDDKEVWVTPAQAEALTQLIDAKAGGCAGIHGYIPSTGYIINPVVDLQVLTKFSYKKLLKRKRDALETIIFADVQDAIADEIKLSVLGTSDQNALFETRKQALLKSIDTTLEGVRDDAHRQGHDRCYVGFADGIKAHLVTEKGTDGLKYPVMLNGFPVVDSIVLGCIELNRKVIKEGVYKPVNSGAPVLMGNAIESLLNKRSVSYKAISLKADNFDRVVISKQEFLPENVSPNVLEVL